MFACDLPWEPTLDEAIRDLQRRKGTLVQVHELAPRLDGETTVFDVTLTSSTGLVVQARVRRALGATADDPRAAAAVVGGVHTGRSAVDLLPNDNAHV
ncbi:MAG: hypothetical protein GWN71_36330, partial [Gammaproteobacteria bacterium]|nr:hypothetical protein [Gemmatimonadota bacterium]NIU78825.1 hypothetical protein [Gammaproteobacteria bacterium]